MASKPTQRSLEELRNRGYTPAIVERWNQFAKIRQDLYGFIDIVAIKAGETGVLAIQCCADDGSVQKRIDKLTPMDNVKTWLKAGNRLEIWGWGKRGGRGERKTWTLRAVPFVLSTEEPVAYEPETV